MFKQRWDTAHEEFVLTEFAKGTTGREIWQLLHERFGANYSFHAVHTKIGRLRGTVAGRSAEPKERRLPPLPPTSAQAIYAHLPYSYRQLLLRVEAYHDRATLTGTSANGQARPS